MLGQSMAAFELQAGLLLVMVSCELGRMCLCCQSVPAPDSSEFRGCALPVISCPHDATVGDVPLQALLAFLNTESERLVGRHTAITSAAAAAMAAAGSHSRSSSAGSQAAEADPGTPGGSKHRSNRPGQGLFRAMQRGLMGLGSVLQGGDSPASDSSHQQPEHGPNAAQLAQQQQQQQWKQLSRLCWCPVLAEAPDAALPWRDSSSARGRGVGAGDQVQRLAAPCAVRPMKDLWLVSAVKAVVDGECQSQVALDGLGW